MTQVKKIYCIHHSHFDVGYTHHQELITELQIQYITQAIELCEKSLSESPENPMRWTIEATYPLSLWLNDATNEDVTRLKNLVAQQIISITALPFHTTPLNDSYQIRKLLETKQEIEETLETKITTAINHDINGQPWSFSDLLLDAGVDFYLTGENIHFGGIPFPRPKAFYWQTPSDRQLLSFLGEHYSLFSQFLNTDKRDISLMKEGLDEYLTHLEKVGYDKEFIILTATNPPLLDNNAPDFGLVTLVNEFNEVYKEQQISFITPEMLRDEILKSKMSIEVKSGDWTDFWNFGSGSTPKEVSVNRKATQNIKHAEKLASLKPIVDNQFNRVKKKATFNSLMYNEHTWGAAESITEPYSRNSQSQLIQKANYAYQALAQSSFVLNKALDNYNNEALNNESTSYLSFTNLGNFPQQFTPSFPKYLLEQTPFLSALKTTMHYDETKEKLVAEVRELKPLETIKIPISEFKAASNEVVELPSDGKLETEHYVVSFDPVNFLIQSIVEKSSKRNILSKNNKFGFFDLIVETIDSEENKPNRATFFPRDIDLANYSISVWNHEWQGKRKLYKGNSELNIEKIGNTYKITQLEKASIGNVEWVRKELLLNDYTKDISIDVSLKSVSYLEPISHYLSIPTSLEKNWQCVYESADTMVKLDEQQLENVSKDWVTLGSSASFFNEDYGLYFATKDSPLLQFNDFQFGKENKMITRDDNPLFLSWIYNNYWDTNFKVSEDGILNYQYVIRPFETFNTIEQYALGEQVRESIVSTWSTKSEEIEKPFKFESDSAVVISSERIKEDTILLHIKNLAETKTTMNVSSEVFEFLESYQTNLLANQLNSQLKIEENQIILELDKNEHQFIQIKVK